MVAGVSPAFRGTRFRSRHRRLYTFTRNLTLGFTHYLSERPKMTSKEGVKQGRNDEISYENRNCSYFDHVAVHGHGHCAKRSRGHHHGHKYERQWARLVAPRARRRE